MQRRQFAALVDLDKGFFGQQGRSLELFAAVHDAVANRADLGQILDDADFGVGQFGKDRRHRFDVGGQRIVIFILAAGSRLVGKSPVDPDTFAKAFRHDLFGLAVDQLILQRRASAVDD